MLRVYGCITEQHDIRLVVLAGMICLFASYTAFSLIARAHMPSQKVPTAWLGVAAVVLGCGVWATHFIAMLAYRPNLPLGFDSGLTGLSVLVAVAVSGAGLLVAHCCKRATAVAVIGGAIIGSGVGAMHYIGMQALIVAATKVWDATYVHTSLAIGIAGTAAAIWIAWRDQGIGTRIAASGVLALAICGLHFTAMAALSLDPDPRIGLPDEMLAPEWMAVAITAIAILIVSLGLIGSIVDQHLAERSVQEADRLRHYVVELEAAKRDLEIGNEQMAIALDAAAVGSQAKSRFLAVMSHELRTPLNAIVGFSEMVAAEMLGPVGNPRYREYSKSIVDSAKHLLALINDILDFSRLDAGHLELHEEAIDLARVIADVTDMMRLQAENARIELCTELPEQLPRLWADNRRLRQVLLNLISNAIKFMPEGGEVHISLSVPQDAETGLAIAVTDTGIGMAPEQIPVALERFGQIDCGLNRNYEGSGLGLPLSKSLVELHGGALSIQSAPGVGTTVTIAFPAERLRETQDAA
jgi:signal transduction histidine kinase